MIDESKLSKAELEELENPELDNEEKEKPIEEMNNEDIITCLLSGEADDKPTRTIPIKRENGISFPVTVKAITTKQFYRIRTRNTRRVNKSGTKELDVEGFNAGVVAAATVTPKWGDTRLLKKYTASSGEEVLKRILLAGEMSLLAEVVMDLSGFNTTLNDIKNL